MNMVGLTAVALSLVAFVAACVGLRRASAKVRWAFVFGSGILAAPALLFTIYYLHWLPEWAWFYTLRSWRGSELLVVFAGCVAGALAACLPRLLIGVPLFALLLLAIIPYLKPILAPLPDEIFRERQAGGVTLQSTFATCGPACVSTILNRYGVTASERAIARAAFSYGGGTEAWYLARYVRAQGLVPRFHFADGFAPSLQSPAVVGVRLGGAGHFIAVLEVQSNEVTFVDPLVGEERLPLDAFRRRYQFTGFHLTVERS